MNKKTNFSPADNALITATQRSADADREVAPRAPEAPAWTASRSSAPAGAAC
jgi:hypothetical protein